MAMEKINNDTSEIKRSEDHLDARYVHCLNSYSKSLKDNTPIIGRMYDGYIQNYNKTDGTLLDINLFKDEFRDDHEIVKK